MSNNESFDWCATNGDVIVPEQRATAVYVNHWGQAVIKQERAWNEEEDVIVVICKEFLPDVIARLRAVVDANPQRTDPDVLKREEAVEQEAARQSTAGPVARPTDGSLA